MTVPGRPATSTVRVAVAALVAALAAVLAARGPASVERTVVQWAVPAAAPDAPVAEPVFEPVLLSVHVPERLTVVVPCSAGTAPGTVFASMAQPGVGGRLQVDVVADAVVFGRDALRLASVPLSGTGCSAAFEVRVTASGAATWTLARNGLVVAGGETDPPLVSGLLGVARTTGEVRATLVSRPATTHPSAAQWVFLGFALAGLVVALRSAAGPRTERPADAVNDEPAARARARRTRRAVDGAVALVLTVWALLGPWFFDDGWLMATVRAREGSGSFSNVFDTLATQMPLGFVHHVLLWPFAVLDLPFLAWRLVPLLACVITWLVLRRLLDRLCAPQRPRPAAVAALAVFHCVAAAGFLVTLRPEPVVAMLTVLALERVLVHTATGAPRPLGVAFVLVAAACTLHPSGFVAVVALVPAAARLRSPFFRTRAAVVESMAMASCGFATGVVLLFADTDITRWRAARAAFAADGFHDNGPLDELVRYRDLLTNAGMLQLAVVLAGGLALVAWGVAVVAALVVRRRRGSSPAFAIDLLPGLLLALAVVLLALTPSKWIYHFGSVAAIAALVVAVETERVARRTAAQARLVAPVVVVAAALLGIRSFAHPKDPQYFLSIGRPEVGLLGRPVTWVVVAVLALALLVRPNARVVVGSWAVASVLLVVLVAAGVTSVVRPVADGPAWSTPRALLDDLLGGGCPITGSIDVGDPRRAVALGPVALASVPAPPAAPPVAAPAGAPEGFAAAAVGTRSAGAPAWLGLAATRGTDLVLAVRGDPAATVQVEWATGDGRVLTTRAVTPAPRTGSPYGPALEWQLVRVQRGQSGPPAGAVGVRAVVVEGDATVLGPVAMPSRSLRSVLEGARALVSPPELPLLRCTRPARVAHGVAEVPDVVIGFEARERVVEIPELQSESSPWFLSTDVQPMRALIGWLDDDHAVSVQVRDTAAGRPGAGRR